MHEHLEPWLVAFFGFLAGALGGFLVYVGLDEGGALIVIGWVLSGLGGMALFVGLIGLGVQLGVAAAGDR